ncbi:MAG TPA: LCP family protein [Streptosporangiaceae bacterium]|nr:LCP family protein [Streptosporangiaceae bacterium]
MHVWPDDFGPGGGVARRENSPEAAVAEWGFQPSAASWPGHAGPGARWPDRPAPPRWAGRGRARRPRRRLRWAMALSAAGLSVLLAGVIAGYRALDARLTRVPVLADYQGRPAPSAGQNWLITGSDSRQGLSQEQLKSQSLGTDVSGRRSDTIMLLHVPGNGARPTLVSLPRDSDVPIPGHGRNKLNAAFSFGGPALLARTVQDATGLRIGHYVGIGFGGLVRVVNAVDGVRVCVGQGLHDRASGLSLPPGCHLLTGASALAYLRDRHSFSHGDLKRIQDQRQFLRALLQKATEQGTITSPVTATRLAVDATGALTVDQGTHLYQLIQVAARLRHPRTVTVPLAGGTATRAGDVLRWNQAAAHRLFSALGRN